MSTKGFDIVVAATMHNGIGFQGKLPWPRIKEDMNFFQRLTQKSAAVGKRNAVIMGRKTWESLPDSACPLAFRVNIIVTRKSSSEMKGVELKNTHNTTVHVANGFQAALDLARQLPNVDRIFVIGGGKSTSWRWLIWTVTRST